MNTNVSEGRINLPDRVGASEQERSLFCSEIRVHSRDSRETVCRHCGAALIDDRMRASGFCCAGCSYVHRLVHEHGLAGYYRIKDEITAPADVAVFQTRDYAWL